MQFSQGGQCTAEAAAHISFTTTNVTLNSGEAQIQGYFYNSGNTGARVLELIIRNITTTDNSGNLIWSDHNVRFNEDTGSELGFYIAPGESRYVTLYYWDSDIPAFGAVNFDVYSRTIQSN